MNVEKPEFTVPLHDGTEEQMSIIIVHRNSPDYLNICLQSICVNSMNNRYEIIVVDNGSDQDSQNYLDEIKDQVKVVRNNKNLYWTQAMNMGIAHADKKSKYYILMHADVVVLNRAWLDILATASVNRSAGLVGVELQHYLLGDQKTTFIQEWLCLITKECWKECGPFDEKLKQIGPAFLFTAKASQRGFGPAVVKTPVAHHYKIFGFNINEFERLQADAMAILPKLLGDMQSERI